MSQPFGYYQNFTGQQDVYKQPPSSSAARMIERKESPACETKMLECNPLWHQSATLVRGLVQLCGSFMMVFTSLLLMVSYDVTVSPMASSLSVALPYFLVLSICPSYHFNPVLTFVGGLIPLTPGDFAPDPTASKSKGPSTVVPRGLLYHYIVHVIPRLFYDITAQLLGSIIASVLVWRGMNMSGTDIISRFDAQMRSDMIEDKSGAYKVFWCVFIFSMMLAIVYYGIRFSEQRTTCISVNTTINPVKVLIISASYFLFTAALAPIMGVGGLNLLVSIGPAVATTSMPIYYASVIIGQVLGFGAMAIIFRFAVYRHLHTCGCSMLTNRNEFE